MMLDRNLTTGLMVAMLCIGCGGAEEQTTAIAAEEAAPAIEQPSEPTGETVTEPEVASVGSVAFSVDGQTKRFDYLPENANTYVSLSSAILAKPSAGAVEQLMITFLSIDLKKVDYPAELPLPRGSAPPTDLRAAMATVGFSYQAEDGTEWAGPGKVRVESFRPDGFIEGTFTNVSLPHTDKQRPNVVLTDGSFRVRISSPW